MKVSRTVKFIKFLIDYNYTKTKNYTYLLLLDKIYTSYTYNSFQHTEKRIIRRKTFN